MMIIRMYFSDADKQTSRQADKCSGTVRLRTVYRTPYCIDNMYHTYGHTVCTLHEELVMT
jgi:hypothetical protein